MALLDIQIVASSVADISAGLAASPDEASWIQTAYLMAEIVMIPLSGVLSRAFSTRWLFTASAAGFTLASIACGFAWNIESMIAARALQGFVGGAMVPTVFATGFAMFKGARQALIPAILGLTGTLAPTIGPTLGGWLTETLSWHWLFFVNVVPGLVITIAIPLLGRVDDPDRSLLRKFDAIGLGMLAVSLGSLEYVLEEGFRWGWLGDEGIQLFTWIAAIAGAGFLVRTLHHPSPVVDLRLLGNRTFATASLFNFVTGFGIFGAVYLLPLFLARIGGFNALQIGQAVFIAGVSMVLGTPITAALSRKADPRIMMTVGLSLFALSLWLMTPITSQWTGVQLFWPQFLRGFSMMFCIVPATNMALGAVPPERLKMASALFNTMRNLGGAIGIACVNTWLNSRTNFHWLRLCEHLQIGNPRMADWLAGVSGQMQQWVVDPEMAHQRSIAILARMTRREAVTMAFSDVLWLMSLLFFVALLLVPLLRRTSKPTSAIEAH
jgi:DHA2 family multidrug resistance protein